MIKKEVVNELRHVLIRRRDALRQALAGDLSLMHELREQSTGDMFDFAADTASDELNSQLAEVESRELTQIEEALKRISEGSYGVCDDCGKPIPMKRLQALPYATECIDCKRRSEARPTMGGWRGLDTRTMNFDNADSSF